MKNASSKKASYGCASRTSLTVGTVAGWLDAELRLADFHDVSHNGLQLGDADAPLSSVAFAVDASVRSVCAAAASGAQLLVVHHGISWGGGIERLTGGVYNVAKAAIEGRVAIYAAHLPLDASRKYGNNWELARYLGLTRLEPAFSYHGNVIGLVGYNRHDRKIGVCSGGAGEFAAEAKALGCDLYVTGEASWGDRIAAENVGMAMITAGHYETETFGVRALAKAVKRRFRIETRFLPREGGAVVCDPGEKKTGAASRKI